MFVLSIFLLTEQQILIALPAEAAFGRSGWLCRSGINWKQQLSLAGEEAGLCCSRGQQSRGIRRAGVDTAPGNGAFLTLS